MILFLGKSCRVINGKTYIAGTSIGSLKCKTQKEDLEKTVNDLEQSLEQKEKQIEELKGNLQSAHNQMASDKEVKYYLDENYTRVIQELEYKTMYGPKTIESRNSQQPKWSENLKLLFE